MELITPTVGIYFWITLSVIAILSLTALIDVLKSRFVNNDKLVWTIVVIFVFVIGPILYFTLGKRQKETVN